MKQEVKIGIVVTLSIAILIWGISYLKGNNLFSSDNYFYAEFDDIQGIKASASVMLNGYKIGYLRNISLAQSGGNKLTLELSILGKYSLPKDSKALIFSTDVMGTKAIKIVPGTSAELLKDGDKIASGIEIDLLSSFLPLKDQISGLVSSIDTLLKSVHSILDTAAQRDIKQTLANLSNTSAQMSMLMQSERARLHSIFSNVDSLTTMLRKNSKNLSRAMQNFANISDTIAKSNLKRTIENADKTLAQTSEIMKKINSGQGSLGALVHNDTLYHNLKNSTESLNKLLIDMKENPKRYVHFSLVGKKNEK